MSNTGQTQGSFTVTLEKAWHHLMMVIAVRNQSDAQQAEIASRGIQRIMGRR